MHKKIMNELLNIHRRKVHQSDEIVTDAGTTYVQELAAYLF